MFRAAVLLIVFAFAVGPNAALVCADWCHPQAASPRSCEHEDFASTPKVMIDGSCEKIAAASPAMLREEMRRGVSTANVQHIIVDAAFQFVPPPTALNFGREPGQHPPLDAKPLILVLRI